MTHERKITFFPVMIQMIMAGVYDSGCFVKMENLYNFMLCMHVYPVLMFMLSALET